MIARHCPHLAHATLQPEVLLEDPTILGAHLQQRVDGFIGDIVAQVARADRRGESTERQVFALPVGHQGPIDFAQDVVIGGKDPEERMVGRLPLASVRMPHIGGEFFPREFLGAAIHGQRKAEAVGDHVVECMHGAAENVTGHPMLEAMECRIHVSEPWPSGRKSFQKWTI